MIRPTIPQLEAAYRRLGYAWFAKGAYNLNLFGIRSPERRAGEFDDLLGVAYRPDVDGQPAPLWDLRLWPATVDPDPRYLLSPINPRGTAILVPGQYRGSHAIGWHRASSPRGHEALVQVAKVHVYRDSNRDETLDWSGDEHAGFYGINIHRPGGSAGCQTPHLPEDFYELMTIAWKARRRWGNRFTYTLLTEDQLS